MDQLISIIMPVYNGQRFLARAIETVLIQTYSNWELIVVDDGSTDSTLQVLDQYQDRRIIKLTQPNSGEAAARNAGLAHARGVFIAFLDADDLYLPDALARLAAFLIDNPQFDVVFSNGYVIDEHERRLSQLSDHRPGIYVGNILEPLILDAAVVTMPICTLTRRTAIDHYGARFDLDLVIGPDWDFWIQLAQYGRFGYLDRLTCAYRIHQTNITRRSGWQRRRADFVRIRMKVLNAQWFCSLTLATRARFIERLLDLVIDDKAQERSILNHDSVTVLPPMTQATLWRQVGRTHILYRPDIEFAAECFRTALQKASTDGKSKILLYSLAHFGRRLTIGLIKIQEFRVELIRAIRRRGRARPKPLPNGLGSFKKQSI